MMKAETMQVYRERILRVLIHIQGHLDDSLSLDDLGRIACFSPFHFHRVFTGLVGESVKGHIRRLRLERAVHSLKGTGQSVLDIALDAGYETHESFTRAFRGMFGLSPSEARRNHRSVLPVRAASGVYFQPGGEAPDFNPITTGGVPMDVKIEKVDPIRVAFVRHVGPYEECGSAWQTLCSWAGRKGLFGPNSRMLGISHDDPDVTPPEKIRYDACVTVDESVQPEGDVGVQEIPGGEYAVATHKGPYVNLKETYSKICGEWAPRSGREMKVGPCFEAYLNDPERTPPEELLTDVHVPLEPR